jgi:hypothetical protein
MTILKETLCGGTLVEMLHCFLGTLEDGAGTMFPQLNVVVQHVAHEVLHHPLRLSIEQFVVPPLASMDLFLV